MAILALWPQTAEVHVFSSVAPSTGFRRFFVIFRDVAVSAFHRRVLVKQRKLAVLVVVEKDADFPTALVVTFLAFLAEPTLVNVVLAVAGHAFAAQLVELGILGVTALARSRQVLAEQRKLRVAIVIEC